MRRKKLISTAVFTFRHTWVKEVAGKSDDKLPGKSSKQLYPPSKTDSLGRPLLRNDGSWKREGDRARWMPSLGKAGVKGHEGRPFLPPAAKRTRRPRININLKSLDVSQTASNASGGSGEKGFGVHLKNLVFSAEKLARAVGSCCSSHQPKY